MRVGIIGAGSIAQRAHIPGWQSIPEVQVAALCATEIESADSVAKAFGVVPVFSDYREMLKLDLDAVSICVPNALHFPVALAALQSGKHVLCEKPLALTAADVKTLGEASERSGLLLMTQHQLRFASPARAARAQVDAEKLGFVYHARVKALRRTQVPTSPGFIDKALSGGGPAFDIGVHPLDMALWLMDFPRPVRVTGSLRTNFDHGKGFSVEDFAAGFVHFENGSTMTIESSWMGHHETDSDLSCELLGTKGRLRWPEENLPAVAPREKPHFAAIRAFYEAIRDGQPSPVPWRQTRDGIAIVEALYRSAAEGREIFIPEAATPSDRPA